MTEKEYLSLDDLESMFGVTEATIRSWVRLGKFPQPIRLSRRVLRWRRDAVEQHMITLQEEAKTHAIDS